MQAVRNTVRSPIPNALAKLMTDPAALVAFTQQIITPHSKLPLPINSSAVVILQQYLDGSAVCGEIFDAWNEGDKVCFSNIRLAIHGDALWRRL